MQISVTDQNKDKIEEMLRAVNGRASEHTYNYYTQIKSLVAEAEERLGLLVPKKCFAGAKFYAESGEKVPNAYKYARKSTVIYFERGAKDWFIMQIKADQVYKEGGSKSLSLTEEQDVKAVEMLRHNYRIQKAILSQQAA